VRYQVLTPKKMVFWIAWVSVCIARVSAHLTNDILLRLFIEPLYFPTSVTQGKIPDSDSPLSDVLTSLALPPDDLSCTKPIFISKRESLFWVTSLKEALDLYLF